MSDDGLWVILGSIAGARTGRAGHERGRIVLGRIAARSNMIVGVVAFALFMDYLIYGVLIPLTPYSPAHATSEEELGLLYSSYAAGVLVATPLFGWLGDRIGYRRLIICGVALSATALALFCFAPHFHVLLLARLLQGAASAASWIAGLALIAEHYPEKRVEMMGFALMGSTAGSLIGPVIGGSLYEVGGYTLPFAVTGALVAVDAALCLFLLPPRQSRPAANSGIWSLLIDRSVVVAATAVGLAAIGWGVVEPLLPPQLMRSGVAPWAIGLVFTIGSIAYGASAPLVGWVSNRLPVRLLIAAGTAAMAVALPFLSLYRGAVGAGVGLAVVNVCYAFMLNPTSAELGDAVDRRGLNCYAAVYAIYNVAYAVGQMAATSFASVASARLNVLQILLCVSAAMIIFIPLLLLRPSPLPQTASTPSIQP
jgi:MFS transporter, DHA1 family, solute carrier family 18 (vesicular amine transporter), member 1/2